MDVDIRTEQEEALAGELEALWPALRRCPRGALRNRLEALRAGIETKLSRLLRGQNRPVETRRWLHKVDLDGRLHSYRIDSPGRTDG